MKTLINLVIISLILSLASNANSPTLTISRSKEHDHISGPFTPLVISFLTEDKATKEKPLDLICIVDKSGSMSHSKIDLVKESLKWIVNEMNETDRFALITFAENAYIIHSLAEMTQHNKESILRNINSLYAWGGTNIFSGLKLGLSLLNQSYSSGDRIASIILLSDGEDNYNYHLVDEMFKELLETENKTDYVFTLNTFGYGSSYDHVLMKDIALIKPGAFFHIQRLKEVEDAYGSIYGLLSTVSDVNVQLKALSEFNIVKVYGLEDMYKGKLINGTSKFLSSFETTIIQLIYGRPYNFVLLVDVPKNTPYGTGVLNVTMPSLGLNAKYLWDGKYSKPAYEEYIRCFVVIIFMKGYNGENIPKGIEIIEEEKKWMNDNYNGTRNWNKELDGAINDLSTNNYANLLSKITELKTSATIGIHYDVGNSYQRLLLSKIHSLDISRMTNIKLKGQHIINYIHNINYYLFYLKEGSGLINNMPYSGENSTLILYNYDNSSGYINITSLSDSMECYYENKSVTRVQSYADFNRIGKFIIKKEFPFDFYTPVDGKKDITFNIEFFKINLDSSINLNNILVIKAYIFNDNEDIDDIVSNENTLSRYKVFNGTFDNKYRIGKVAIKKEDIYYNLDSVHENYLYVIVKLISNNKITFSKKYEGKFIFVPNNYIYSSILENHRIYSNLEMGENNPHLYTLDVGTSKNNSFLIEIENYGSELDFKILQYQNGVDDIMDKYNDYDNYNILRIKDNKTNTLYINVTRKTNETLEKIILSIFSTKKNHISGNDINNLTYIFKYNTYYSEIHTMPTTPVIPEIPVTTPIEKVKKKFIILGFANYIYIKASKIINFFIYFVHIKTDKYIYKEIFISVIIKYKKGLKSLQNDIKNKAKCVLTEKEFDNQDKYNCTLDTTGEDIDNIELDKNIEINDDNIEISGVEVSPIGNKYLNGLQNVGNSNIFDKKLYLLKDTTIKVDNINNTFNITGTLDDDYFNHTEIELEMTLLDNSKQKLENITCNPIKGKDGLITLQCNTNKDMKGILDNAFANLENENLMINLPDSEKIDNNKINFEEKISPLNNTYFKKKSSGGLSTGGIIVIIIIPSALVLILVILGILVFRRKKNIKINNDNSTVISNMNSSDKMHNNA